MNDKQVKKRYRDCLDKQTSERYFQKCSLIDGKDPYDLRLEKNQLKSDMNCLPAVTYIDIINYLVNTKSAYTMEELKAYKSLEAFNQFVCGWVQDVRSMKVEEKVLILARVRHSQRMNETALKPWVIADSSGVIDAAHCDCMAGLGEACSHIGALLFYLEAATRINSSKTVTQEKAYWLLPSSIDKVPYSMISDIDFTSAETKKRKLDNAIDGKAENDARSALKLPEIRKPSASEKDSLLNALFQNQSKAAILTVSGKYQEKFVPEILSDGQLPEPLINLRDEKYLAMSADELRKECEILFGRISVSEKQVENVEIITRNQSRCKEWHRLRMGRITASIMKSVCVACVEKPALSTIQAVIGQSRFKNVAMEYGCRHEQNALHDYSEFMKTKHDNFFLRSCGLYLSSEHPFLGATPDGLTSCDCCGEGLVEVKCPYCAKDSRLSDCNIDFLKDGKLKAGHRYAYQVQTQLTVTGREYCDFVVWTANDLLVERIQQDENLENEILVKSKNFFLKAVLPEITGNLITREKNVLAANEPQIKSSSKVTGTSVTKSYSVLNSNKVTSPNGQLVCVCGTQCSVASKKVVKCDSENCVYGLLHYECVDIKRKPKSPYYCPKCRKTNW